MGAIVGIIICGIFACFFALGVKAGEEHRNDDDNDDYK
jgi:hypothetical protein